LTLPLTLASCSGFSSWHEAKRVLAPRGGIDAVLAERNAGSPTGFRYEVFVVLNGTVALGTKPVATLEGATRNDSAYGASLNWVGPDTLRIEYLRAERETLLIPDVSVGGRRIRILLAAGKRDSLARAGGMVQARR
jgi:hypothetical protein